MLPRLALLLAGLVLAGTMPAAGAPGDCVTKPDQDETIAIGGGQYLYLKHPADATKTDVSLLGIWEETNGRGHLQTEDCKDASGGTVYRGDKHSAAIPLV